MRKTVLKLMTLLQIQIVTILKLNCLLKLIISLFFILGNNCSQAQTPLSKVQSDSLLSLWNSAGKADTVRLNALFYLIDKDYLLTQPDSGFYFAHLGYEFAARRKLKNQMAKALTQQGIAFEKRYKFAEALEYYQKSLELYEEIKDKNGIALTLETIGLFYYEQSNYSKSREYFTETLRIFEELNDKSNISYSLYYLGDTYYHQGDYDLALEYYQRCLKIDEELGEKRNIASSLQMIGNVHEAKGNYHLALNYFQRSVKLHEETKWKSGLALTYRSIGIIYTRIKDFKKALDYYQEVLRLAEELSDIKLTKSILISLGIVHYELEDYPKALNYYQRSLNLTVEMADKAETASAMSNLGNVYMKTEEYAKAMDNYQKCLEIRTQIGDKRGIAVIYGSIGSLNNLLKKYKEGLSWCEKSYHLAEELGAIIIQRDACQCIYDSYKAMNKGNEALVFLEKLGELDKQLNKEETAKRLQQMEFRQVMLQDSIAKAEEARLILEAHQIEIRQKNQTRNMAYVGLVFFLLLAAGFYGRWRYVRKSRDIIEKERDRSENLLLNILPAEIAEELKQKGRADARDFDRVSILFTDFKGFTEASAKLSAQDLVAEINTCFEAFDGIMAKYSIEKIKTIGDAYMAAGGLPVLTDDSVKSTVLAALEMQEFITKRKTEKDAKGEPAFEMRVGIHTGPVVAGIVGVKKFQYDIWGDTVNTASRMESSGEVGKVNISQSTYELIKNSSTSLSSGSQFTFENRGKIEAKGKGEIEMYFVARKS